MQVKTDIAVLAEAEPRRMKARQREVERMERRAQAVELRRAGLTYAAIGAALGCTEANAHRMVNRQLRKAISDPAEALVQAELEELELMRTKTLAVLNAQHPLVQAGEVVHAIVRDGKGEPVLDPRTNQPLRLPLHDSKPVLAAIALLERIATSRRTLLGVDAPKKIAMTDTAGNEVPVTDMAKERIAEALEIAMRRLRGPKTGDVVDAEVRDPAAIGAETAEQAKC